MSISTPTITTAPIHHSAADHPCHASTTLRAITPSEPLKACSGHLAGDTLAVDRPPEPKAQAAVTRGTP